MATLRKQDDVQDHTSPEANSGKQGQGLQIFDNGEFNLEITIVGDTFKIQAPGLARSLAFHSARDMLRTVPEDEKGWEIAPTPGGEQEMWHVKEPGFYRVLGQRQAARIKNEEIKAQVVRFQRWVFHEVLPSIRKTGQYGNAPVSQELDELEVAERYVATLKRNRELQAANVALEERADVAERKFAEFEGGPGITLTRFHKKYFSEVPARVFFEHLYAKGYLIDQRGQGPWDEKNQCYKDGPQHFEPSFRGKPFLYLHEAGIFRKKRRFKTLVRPGDPELAFKHRLVADGLRGNVHTTDYLFAIEGGR